MKEEYINIKQSVERLKERGVWINRCHLARKCSRGDVPGAYKLGGNGAWLIPLSSLLAYKQLRIRNTHTLGVN